VQEPASAISEYETYLGKQNLLVKKRTQNWETRLLEMLRDTLLETARGAMSDADLSRWAAEVAENKRDPYSVVEEIAQRVIR
jgi:hypothetical protein